MLGGVPMTITLTHDLRATDAAYPRRRAAHIQLSGGGATLPRRRAK